MKLTLHITQYNLSTVNCNFKIIIWGLSQYVPVHGVQHLDGYQHRQSHGHGVGVLEDWAFVRSEFGWVSVAAQVVSELPPREMGAVGGDHEPPGGGTDSGSSDVT